MRTQLMMAAVAATLLSAALARAADAPAGAPRPQSMVREIEVTMPDDFEVQMPAVIDSIDDVRTALAVPETQRRVIELVDFKTHRLLLFAWRGSGQDRIEHQATEGEGGTEVVFTMVRGMTRDWRPHARLYAIPRAAEWRAVGMAR